MPRPEIVRQTVAVDRAYTLAVQAIEEPGQ
jgi:hypothetical protein